MIGKLTGIISDHFSDSLVVDTVSGVGYHVFVSKDTLLTTKDGSSITLYIHTHVRESELSLYGFSSKNELLLFTILLDVSGIGPKSALAIVNHGPIEDLYTAIQKQNLAYFSTMKGVGTKTAQKILLELSSKFGTHFSLDDAMNPAADELTEALTNLGFQKSEIIKAIQKVKPTGTLEEKIAQCLQLLARA